VLRFGLVDPNLFEVSNAMKNILISTSVAALLGPTTVLADPTFMLGGTMSFGGGPSPQFALTAKVLSDNQVDEPVFGLGANYYLGTGEIGADLGVGYLFDNGALMIGYDFLQNVPTFSAGYAEADDATNVSPTTTPGVTVAPTTTPDLTTIPPTTIPPTTPPP
jgi:hypothetical protein